MKGLHFRALGYSMIADKNSDLHVRAGLEDSMKSLWRFAYSLSGRPDLADDLAQSTCLRALDKAHQADTSLPILPWLLKICRSIWLNERRSQALRRAQSLEVTPEIDFVDAGVDIETNILSREVYSLIMGLPEAQRNVAMLVFVEGFTYREAASVLDVPIGTVMSRLHAVRAKLRDAVAFDGADGKAQ